MARSVLSFLFLLIFYSQAFAISTSSLILSCSQTENCSPKTDEILKQVSATCEIENKALKCDELAADPDLKPRLRQCDQKSLCDQAVAYEDHKVSACLRGYKNALIDTGIALKDMAVGLGDLIDKSWEQMKANKDQRVAFAARCNTSLACKRNLVKDDPRYSGLSDEKLNEIPATALLVEVESRAAYLNSIHRSVPVPAKTSADPNALTKDQQDKLLDLAAVLGEKIKKEYQKFRCYTPEAQQEMMCYAVGNVVDVTVLAGAAFKAARLIYAATRTVKYGKDAEEITKSLKAAEELGNTSRGRFTQKYLNYNPTTEAENKEWIELAKKGKSDGVYFVSVENNQMKYLNDTLKDKNVVTSITNFHKQLTVSKLKELQELYPDLKLTMSSDFKTLNIAGKIPEDLQKKLAQMFDNISAEFATYLKQNKIIRETDTPEKYFTAAIGTSNDETNVTMRVARDMKTGKMVRSDDPDVQNAIGGSLRASEIERESLQKQFGHTRMFDGDAPSAETFDLIRKNKDPQALKSALETRYKTKVSDADVASFQRYANNVDTFSLNPYIAKREMANLNSAVHGGFSADFSGVGSDNVKGTADALTKSSNVQDALANSRKAEQAVTVELNKKKEFFNKVTRESVEPGKLKTVCSGDDCVAIATKPLNEKEKQKILDRVADSKYASKLRFSFINDGVKGGDDVRNTLSTHGESIEKLLRKNLDSQVDRDKLKGLTFGVDMRTTELNQGPVKLLVGQGQDLYLTKAERAKIQKVFKETLDQFNKSITYKNKTVRYEVSP